MPSYAVQLMLSPVELGLFGKETIISKLLSALELVRFERCFLSVYGLDSDFVLELIKILKSHEVKVSLWTMVLADNPYSSSELFIPSNKFKNFKNLVSWKKMEEGGEQFSFSCPSHYLKDEKAVALSFDRARQLGVDSLFLDRIRYPAPSNGFEYFGSCRCSQCSGRYKEQYGKALPDMAENAALLAKDGAKGASLFMKECRDLIAFRNNTIYEICGIYRANAKKQGMEVGLDLFAPALSLLVAQDYKLLQGQCDFIKPMLYTKANAVAGLPLEFYVFVKNLTALEVPIKQALAFTSAISGLGKEELSKNMDNRTFEEALAGSEFIKAKSQCKKALQKYNNFLYAGIELVNHPAYETKISDRNCKNYLSSLSGENIAACWNLLHIPDKNLECMSMAEN